MNFREIFLNPGDFYFGEGDTRLSTLLGSCVSITLWHPLLRHGGMCHYVLDSRGVILDELDGKYADEAIEMFMQALATRKTHPAEYEVKIFGGGRMFADENGNPAGFDVGSRNVEAADRLLDRYGFRTIKARNVGGRGHRRLLFDLWSGDAWLKFQPAETEAVRRTPGE